MRICESNTSGIIKYYNANNNHNHMQISPQMFKLTENVKFYLCMDRNNKQQQRPCNESARDSHMSNDFIICDDIMKEYHVAVFPRTRLQSYKAGKNDKVEKKMYKH